MSYRENYERWLACDKVDEASKVELRAIAEDDEEIEFRFVKGLEFGTGGLRGTMKAGTNAMNVYTVAHATQGLADLINEKNAAERGVAVGYDSRNNSKLFAETCARVLAANGIKVRLFGGLRPTPVLSFAVRELNCIAGINITASHNPKEYNGYKAYWEDGAQLPPDEADIVTKSINEADIFDDVKLIPLADGLADGLIEYIPEEFDEIYLSKVMAEAVNPEVIAKVADDLKIVYTPLHGAGHRLVPEVLERVGFKHIYPVKEQMVLDGNFPTVVKPNPEYPAVFELGIKLAEQVGSDLIVATDPDADRMGIMSRDKSGKFVCLTGNQVGALLLDYIITAYEATKMPINPFAVKTVVSTEIVTEICRRHNVTLFDVLTGFKYIGEVIKQYDDTGKGKFIFGFEESYGYLKGTYARDKDSVVATMLLCEMAAYYKAKSMTLCDALEALYETYGCYGEGAGEIYMEGLDGLERMKQLMNELRENPPKELAGYKVIGKVDYLNDTVNNIESDIFEPEQLPDSNVLAYTTEAGDKVVIRPSGTEPKIKTYILCRGKDMDEIKKKIAAYKETTEAWTK